VTVVSSTTKVDLIVYGATGFTGRLVAEHLTKAYGTATRPSWGMAGRSLEKLAKVRDAIGAPVDTPLFAADASDPFSLERLARSARMIVTTVGPYQLYGSGLVATCAKAGTDYLDINGEPLWMREMIDAHDATAHASGARILFSCGFDSIPSELGVWLCQEAARAALSGPIRDLKGRHVAMNGGAGGGSIATGNVTRSALKREPSLLKAIKDPFLLAPGFAGPPQPLSSEAKLDPEFGPVLPFFLSSINIQNVHRSNWLMNHAYGADFTYDEMIVAEPRGGNPFLLSEGNAGFDLRPGEGPSDEKRAAGFFEMVFSGTTKDGRKVRASVSANADPGHTATARMLAETAICLLDVPEVVGGIRTPVAALGGRLADRLRDRAALSHKASITG